MPSACAVFMRQHCRIFFLLLALFLAACNGSDSPTANAGADQVVRKGATVTLDGSASSSPRGSIDSYQWRQTAGTGVSLSSGGTQPTATFTAPNVTADQTLTFELRVTSRYLDATDTVSVLVKANMPPTANAGADKEVKSMSPVSLTGSGADPDGDALTYHWTQTSGSTTTIIGASDTATLHFTAPFVTADTSLTFTLTVKDSHGSTGTDSVSVLVKKNLNAPVVNAGSDQTVYSGDAVSLPGTASDADGDTLTYNWSQTAGPAVSLSGAVTATLSFTAPTVTVDTRLSFTLTVSDGRGGARDDAVSVLVKPRIVPPVTPTGKINDTGITRCGDYAAGGSHNNDVVCGLLVDANNDPVPQGQDAQFGRDITRNDDSDGHAGFSFTKIGTHGEVLPASATSWSCVRDNVTGLIWEGKTATSGLHAKQDKYTWYQPDVTKNGGDAGFERQTDSSVEQPDDNTCFGYKATDSSSYCNTHAYVKRVNVAGWCGANDWRLPTMDELAGIASLEGSAIDTNYFPNTPLGPVWSSSPVMGYSEGVVGLDFTDGDDLWYKKKYGGYVRLVRGVQ